MSILREYLYGLYKQALNYVSLSFCREEWLSETTGVVKFAFSGMVDVLQNALILVNLLQRNLAVPLINHPTKDRVHL